MNRILHILLILTCCATTMAQQLHTISGTVIDAKTNQSLPGAIAMVTATTGGTPKGESTDLDGKFSFKASGGTYVFKVTYMGYKTYEKTIELKADLKLGNIRLRPEDKQLDEVKVKGVLQRQEQKGDTTVFNADAFKVNPDASTEDLIKKMPGMQVSGNSVTAGGETVKKVLVDGKEYFGSDPMAALRNISADMVSKIEVYDRQSDQSQFTGFSDGNEEKTINILTKMGISKGSFGRVYGGYGTDNRYEMGGNMNFFRGTHRWTVIGMLNNINQQNMSISDITGAMSNGAGMGGMFTAGKSGKNRTGIMGFNYVYDKTDTLRVEFSYKYSNSKNTNHSTSIQEYFTETEEDSLRIYDSESNSEGHNYNNDATLRLTWTIDKKNSIIFTPNISWQSNDNISTSEGEDTYDGKLYSFTWQNSDSKTDGLSGRGNITWRHKFDTDRRTFSVNLGASVSNNESDKLSYNVNDYTYNATRSMLTSQRTDNENKSTNANASIMYTEPVGDYLALQVNYSPSYSYSRGDKMVDADTMDISYYKGDVKSLPEFEYTFSQPLSNKKSSEYWRHKGGIGVNFFKDKNFNASASLDFQEATLSGEQIYPYAFNTNKSFFSILPSANLRYRKDRTLNIRLRYRTNTNAPSINQLQKVVDVSNSRRYSGGNNDLNQAYSQTFMFMLHHNNAETSRGIFLHTNFTTTHNYIATSSIIATQDTVIDNGILLPKGVQYDKPVNMNGYWTGRINLTLSTPVSWLGSNVNFNVGANASRRPSLYNNRRVENDESQLSAGLMIGSSFSENIDFSVGYNGSYNIEKSTKTASSNYNYYRHSINCNLNCLFFTRLVITNDLSHQYLSGMGDNYDLNYINWNASIGCKLFANKRGDIRLKVNDILNNTSSVSRSIQSAYVQTASTDVLRRYALLTFTYTFKPRGDQPKQPDFGGNGRQGRMGPPPSGGPRNF